MENYFRYSYKLLQAVLQGCLIIWKRFQNNLINVFFMYLARCSPTNAKIQSKRELINFDDFLVRIHSKQGLNSLYMIYHMFFIHIYHFYLICITFEKLSNLNGEHLPDPQPGPQMIFVYEMAFFSLRPGNLSRVFLHNIFRY